jgi:hypothetical protein
MFQRIYIQQEWTVVRSLVAETISKGFQRNDGKRRMMPAKVSMEKVINDADVGSYWNIGDTCRSCLKEMIRQVWQLTPAVCLSW